MKKNEIFTFTAPNGVEVTGVVIDTVFKGTVEQLDYCYAQNRLFTWKEVKTRTQHGWKTTGEYGEVIVDYCILPDYDAMLEAEQQKFDDDCYEALSSIGDMDF